VRGTVIEADRAGVTIKGDDGEVYSAEWLYCRNHVECGDCVVFTARRGIAFEVRRLDL
jgi:hypothetical protein